jgi:hypothetical protein
LVSMANILVTAAPRTDAEASTVARRFFPRQSPANDPPPYLAGAGGADSSTFVG